MIGCKRGFGRRSEIAQGDESESISRASSNRNLFRKSLTGHPCYDYMTGLGNGIGRSTALLFGREGTGVIAQGSHRA
ncbi:MAG: hypothetical protein DMG06_12890 [Acidobacteria bacterium]|nr:MAG: hypothetical protein DMG06_12890 [Acidobacteriota bacterium]